LGELEPNVGGGFGHRMQRYKQRVLADLAQGQIPSIIKPETRALIEQHVKAFPSLKGMMFSYGGKKMPFASLAKLLKLRI
jgi:hypothetical protein